MTHVILDNPRRRSADLTGTLLVCGQAIGFGVLPILVLVSPKHWSVMWSEWLIVVLAAIVSLLGAAIAAWRVLGREVIALDGGVLHVNYTAGFFRRSVRLPLTPTTEVRLKLPNRSELPNNAFGVGHRPVIVRNAAGKLRCGMGLGEQQAEALAKHIREASSA
jgi:hypothetical protein